MPNLGYDVMGSSKLQEGDEIDTTPHLRQTVAQLPKLGALCVYLRHCEQSSAKNRVTSLLILHVHVKQNPERADIDPISERLCLLVFVIPGHGRSPEPQ
jgi:hypothetical protein